jgi:hypothetical protein
MTERKKSKPIIIAVDEVGDHGEPVWNGKEYQPSKTFNLGLSIVEDPDSFGDITTQFKREKGIKGEFKARKRSMLEKVTLGWKIRKNGAKTSGVYVDKTMDVPDGWKEQTGADNQLQLLKLTLDDTIQTIESDEIIVVVDEEDLYYGKNKNGKRIEDRVKDLSEPLSNEHKKNIKCRQVGEPEDDYFAVIETNDVVARSVFDRKERHKPFASLIMGQKIRRFGSNVSVRKK